MEVVTDRKIAIQDANNPSKIAYYEAVVVSYSDYYPFGMQMAELNGATNYRFAFNGMEQDMEVSGSGNSYTTMFRQYDPRLGRWKSLDPLMHMFPDISPFVGMGNNPIYFTDPYGLAPTNGGESEPDKTSDDPKEGDLKVGKDGNSYIYSKEIGWNRLLETVSATADIENEPKINVSKSKDKIDNIFEGSNIPDTRRNPSRSDNNTSDYIWTSEDLDIYYSGKMSNVVKDQMATGNYRSLTAIKDQSMDIRLKDSNNSYRDVKRLMGMFKMLMGFISVPMAMPVAAPVLTGTVSTLGPSYVVKSVQSGAINAGINVGTQLVLNDWDYKKIDIASAGISFGSGFLPGSTGRELWRNAAIAGTADGMFDYSLNDGHQSIFNRRKSLLRVVVDASIGTVTNRAGLGFGNYPTVYNAWGAGVTNVGGSVVNEGVNEAIRD